MIVPNCERVDYWRRYYAEHKPKKQAQAREGKRCRYRIGWANWLIAELRLEWAKEVDASKLN